MSKVELPLEVVNKVLAFMAAQPYSQVVELIDELRNTSKVLPENTEEESKEES